MLNTAIGITVLVLIWWGLTVAVKAALGRGGGS